ncbi:helix-turn-helix domain-containing protein [Yinghuangia soli]|uniref:Helix-turn-helix domain-containing protein n=1 Tax=Yinghuangia soli TaxID=2908204 RepID=A0AA41PV64_9ACTN|nr:helix-turn-helix domain-containing protein [Yinghuangia soli]MCF2525801.1 helix-turn-helix domain-containing protein [Yinghuangia soli]
MSDFDTWRSVVRDTFFPAELERPAGHSFAARLRHGTLGPMGLARIEATPHNFRRTAADVARQRADAYDVVLVLDGRGSAAQGGLGGELDRGHLVIADTTRPYRIDFESPFRLAQLVLPHALLGTEPEELAAVTGVPVETDRGTAALLAALLTQVTEPAGLAAPVGPGSPAGSDSRSASAPGIEPHVADAVAALCRAVAAELLAAAKPVTGTPARHTLPDSPTPASAPALVPPGVTSGPASGTEAQRHALRTRVLAWIDDHLDDPTLDPAAIAAAHYISTRYLHLLFKDQPVSVARHVRERRLDRIRRDLADPAYLGTPVSAVAARWAIGDAAQFSRLFRDRYGVSPSAYRTAAHATH